MDIAVKNLLDAVAVFAACESSMNGRELDQRLEAIIVSMSRDTGLSQAQLREALQVRIRHFCRDQGRTTGGA